VLTHSTYPDKTTGELRYSIALYPLGRPLRLGSIYQFYGIVPSDHIGDAIQAIGDRGDVIGVRVLAEVAFIPMGKTFRPELISLVLDTPQLPDDADRPVKTKDLVR